MTLTTLALSLVLGCILFGQWRLAGYLPMTTRVLVRAQAVFWAFAYIGRSIYVQATQPSLNHPLGDRRLIYYDYQSLDYILTLVVVGLLSTSITYACFAAARPSGPTLDIARTLSPPAWIVVGICFTIGWSGRIPYFFGGEAVQTALAPFAIVSACTALIFAPSATPARQWIFATCILSEATWTVVFASKTPLLAVLTALAIRWARDLPRATILRRFPVLVLTAIAAFLLIQPLKGVDTANDVAEYSDSNASSTTGVLVALMQRADLISAVTDAYYFPSKPWLPAASYASSVALAAVPKGPLVDYEGSGLRWTKEVRRASYPDQTGDVYLATGPVAEGEVQGGVPGVIAESIAIALATLLVGAGLSSRHLSLFFAAGIFTFDTTLYERGVLGVAEGVAKALQVAVVVWVLHGILSAAYRSKVDGSVAPSDPVGDWRLHED